MNIVKSIWFSESPVTLYFLFPKRLSNLHISTDKDRKSRPNKSPWQTLTETLNNGAS